MKEVTYETLSTAVRALSERITALDERIEVSLAFDHPQGIRPRFISSICEPTQAVRKEPQP